MSCHTIHPGDRSVYLKRVTCKALFVHLNLGKGKKGDYMLFVIHAYGLYDILFFFHFPFFTDNSTSII